MSNETPHGSDVGLSAGLDAATAVREFADFLHRLPDEDGYEVGPMRVMWNEHGQLARMPLWATQADTRRWAEMFINARLASNAQAQAQP